MPASGVGEANVEDLLGPGRKTFELWTENNIPAEWKVPPSAELLLHAARTFDIAERDVVSYLAVELPDYPWAWKYDAWVRRNSVPGALRVSITNRDEYRGLSDRYQRAEATIECLRALQQTDKPPPFFFRACGPACQ